ncbi:hypothetical protein RRG08_011512 [Elysia crispata]|uniref:Secreted protein n=1 Tax=Elysia crispata TaxID=231223 RepID=A0AAE1E4J6_9GAST|nr:hypothetical protein RRG08_011512 [Elysia crispata]
MARAMRFVRAWLGAATLVLNRAHQAKPSSVNMAAYNGAISLSIRRLPGSIPRRHRDDWLLPAAFQSFFSKTI